MRKFRVAFTGDFLNDQGKSAYSDLLPGEMERHPRMEVVFLKEQTPRREDADYWRNFYSMEVTPDQLRELDGLVVLRPWVKRPALAAAAERLVVIGRSGAGYDKIDVAACTDANVALFNVPSVLNHSTASAALLFMLALSKKLPQQQRILHDGRWDLQAAVMGSEIQGRTLGIVGLGNSGRELARLVAPFEMRVLAYSPHAEPGQAAVLGVRLTSLEELCESADFISLHARLTPESHGLIGREQISRMKRTAYFINVARGELVDQAMLTAALTQRRIAGAALDVFEHEPLPADDPLTRLDNVILTPHWLASTTDVWQATTRAMVEGMLRAARGELPDNIVNAAVVEQPGFQAKLARFAEND